LGLIFLSDQQEGEEECH